jgi:hypothetical protein
VGMTVMGCPHCGKDIDLVEQRELSEEFGLKPNPVASLRAQGDFPEPVLSFGNRNMWLRASVETYVEQRSRERIARLVEDFERTIEVLTSERTRQRPETALRAPQEVSVYTVGATAPLGHKTSKAMQQPRCVHAGRKRPSTY